MVRRLAWSPDGQFMLTPASIYRDLNEEAKNRHTVYGFMKGNMSQPSFVLPGLKSHATCIKFNPYLFKKTLQPSEEDPGLIELPYKVVFAVATTDQVIVYTTESIYPLAVVGNIHYANINDLAWEGNKRLAIASSDGFCSFLTFENGLGERLENENVPEELREFYSTMD